MYSQSLVLPSLLFAAVSLTAAENLVRNGSFEEGANGQTPAGWHFAANRDADVTMRLTDRQSADGQKSLLIENRTPRQPNVYGQLYTVLKLQPGQHYRLSCRARSNGNASLKFIAGKRWSLRFPLTRPGREWQTYEFEFTAEPRDFESSGVYLLRLLSEGLTDGAAVDAVSIVPAGAVAVDAASSQEQRVYPMPELELDPAQLDRIPAALPVLNIPAGGQFFQGGKMPSPVDLSARIALTWDRRGLVFLAEVRDDRIATWNGAEMWRGDSIQLRLDQEGLLNPGEKKSDLELGFAPSPGGIKTWSWQDDRPLNDREVATWGKTTPGGYFIAARLPWSFLNRIDFNHRRPFSFNVVVNDSDDRQSRRVAFLAPGIHDAKGSDQNTLALFSGDRPWIGIFPVQLKSFREITGRLVVSGITAAAPWQIKAVLTDAKGGKTEFVIPAAWSIRPGLAATADFKFPLNRLADGKYRLDVTVPGTSAAATVNAVKVDLGKAQLAALAEIDQTVAAVRAELPRYYPAGRQPSRYLELFLAEMTRQTALQRRDLQRRETQEARTFYLERGELAVDELRQAAIMLQEKMAVLRRGGHLPATWMYVSSPGTLQNGWPRAEATDEQGRREVRDTFFIGYGHFGDVIRDMARFPSLGGNAIQIEIGPRSFFPRPGTDGDFSAVSLDDFKRRIEPAMKKAWDNNLKICLLLSPHYNPSWLLEKYPELKTVAGFFKYEVNHPKAREMIEKYLAIIIPRLKNSPYRDALHSLCLSNEPIYLGCSLESRFTRDAFRSRLEKKYGAVARFNRQTGSDFADYPALMATGLKNPAVKYEFNLFKRESFAGWHRWMAQLIRERWPEIPLSAKIMAYNFFKPARLNEGVDPELFAHLSDLNGNDNYTAYSQGRWVSDWISMSLTHDLQTSMKPVSVCNSENHIIKDGETNPIPYDHIYTSIFQQLLQGVSSMMTWVWSDINYQTDRKISALRGNIFRRPIDVIAQGMAALDGNRLAPEIVAFCRYEPEVALLYSPASYIMNSEKYCYATETLYTYLCFTGHKIGFRSEKQLAAGNFGRVRVLLAADAANVSPATISALRKFVAGGGRIITYGECFSRDEHDRKQRETVTATALSRLNGEALLAALRRELVGLTPLPLRIKTEKGGEGILWKTAFTPQGTLVNLVNYNPQPRRMTLDLPSGSRAVELISGRELPPSFELPPLQPMLLKVVRR